ncbi:MAG: serine/threonine-protein kinase [Rhodothermales bacterium]
MLAIDPARWQRLAPLLDEALDLPSDARAAFLDAACRMPDGSPDLALRLDLEQLLAADDEAGDFLDDSAADWAATLIEDIERATAEPSLEAGAPVGPYRVVRTLGQGGMGTVYLAERADGQFEQRVALKLIRPGMGRHEILRRFLQERQILARLQHPHIARLLDGGITAEGQPYFAMEFVDGQPITEYCDERRLNLDERLRLFRSVAEAVAYAHRNLVVHRDIKPSNILVTAEGVPKLLDFGIAKLLHETDSEDTLIETQAGLQVMTPEYAAPEQVRGDPVTTATDIYALGVALYELLTGHRPYYFERRTPVEIERVVCEQDPIRPSSVVVLTQDVRKPDGTVETVTPGEVGTARAEPASRLRRRLSGDLDTILLKALRKEPHRRYASAEVMVEDLRRYQDGHPVTARKETVGYRVRKFVRRHRLGVVAVTALVVFLAAGLTGTLIQTRAVEREAERTEAVKDFLLSLFELSDPSERTDGTISARELLAQGAARVEDELAGEPVLQAEMMTVLGDIYVKLGNFEQAQSLYERALALREPVFGTEGAEVAASLHALGALALDRSDFDEAERQSRAALAMRREALGARHPDVAVTMGVLALTLLRKGELDEAEPLFREALTISRAYHGEHHREVAALLNDFVLLRRAQGEYADAERLARESLALHRMLLGDGHLMTATAKNNLAIVLRDQDKLDEAEELYRQVLAFNRERLGEEHPYTSTVTNNLAAILKERGAYNEAELLLHRVLAADLKQFGPNHRYVALVQRHLAAVNLAQGDLVEAGRLAQASLTLNRELFGEAHPSVGDGYTALADILQAMGQFEDAGPLYEQGVAVLRATLPPDHPDIAAALLGQGQLLSTQGRLADAEPLLRESLRIREAKFGDADVRTAEARTALGICLMEFGRYEAARPLLVSACDVLLEKRGSGHALTRQALAALSKLNTIDARARPSTTAGG